MNPILDLGAVLGGLVSFLIVDNPIVVLAEKIGGTIVQGVDRAAQRYLADRSRSFDGNRDAIQNATFGDIRADQRHAEPHANLIDQKADYYSQRIDQISDTLARIHRDYAGGQMPDQAHGAVNELDGMLADFQDGFGRLAGYTSKHRDTIVVYVTIAQGCGLTNSDGFLDRVHEFTAKTNKITASVLAGNRQTSGLRQLAAGLHSQGRG